MSLEKSAEPQNRRVRVLPPAVAERIAAGEVIERPSSVVKELIENSIDAGATEIAVLLEEGGKTLIEVLDNGHGMPREDMELCLQRHATSKLETLADLEKIHTLGFRGEALPSIAAVSDLSLLSRPREQETAYEIVLTSLGQTPVAEARTFGHFLNSAHGTRIQARGLFSQIPARLKFLKSQSAEVSQVREWIERLALAHPQVGFRLVSDSRSIVSLRPQDETSRVRAILSDGDDYPIVTASNDLGFRDRGEGDLHVRVHWLQGLSTPQARRVVQVVNGRALRDRMLQQAVLAPFRQALLPGQFPAVALYIEIDPAQLDVNVHPTKTEIRFLDNRLVFRAVQSVVESMIVRNGAPTYAQGDRSAFAFQSQPSWTAATPQSQEKMEFSRPQPAWMPEPSQGAATWQASAGDLPAHDLSGAAAPTLNPLPTALAPFAPHQYVGAAFNTYLFYDLGHELALVDQHAAHERIRYEKLRARALAQDTPMPQALLLPEAVRFPAETRTALEARLPWLAQLGFDAEVFGEDTLLFRGIPADWGTDELRIRLKSLTERVLAAESAPGLNPLQLDEALFERLASEACHSAVRAGDRLEREEATRLVEQLFSCEHPWNCPHGRPTVVRVPKGRFEEWFQRRV